MKRKHGLKPLNTIIGTHYFDQHKSGPCVLPHERTHTSPVSEIYFTPSLFKDVDSTWDHSLFRRCFMTYFQNMISFSYHTWGLINLRLLSERSRQLSCSKLNAPHGLNMCHRTPVFSSHKANFLRIVHCN